MVRTSARGAFPRSIVARACCRRDASRASKTNRPPCCANSSAMASPNPDEPPVTTIVFPCQLRDMRRDSTCPRRGVGNPAQGDGPRLKTPGSRTNSSDLVTPLRMLLSLARDSVTRWLRWLRRRAQKRKRQRKNGPFAFESEHYDSLSNRGWRCATSELSEEPGCDRFRHDSTHSYAPPDRSTTRKSRQLKTYAVPSVLGIARSDWRCKLVLRSRFRSCT